MSHDPASPRDTVRAVPTSPATHTPRPGKTRGVAGWSADSEGTPAPTAKPPRPMTVTVAMWLVTAAAVITLAIVLFGVYQLIEMWVYLNMGPLQNGEADGIFYILFGVPVVAVLAAIGVVIARAAISIARGTDWGRWVVAAGAVSIVLPMLPVLAANKFPSTMAALIFNWVIPIAIIAAPIATVVLLWSPSSRQFFKAMRLVRAAAVLEAASSVGSAQSS